MGADRSVEMPPWIPAAGDERVWLRISPSRNLLLAGFALAFVILLVMSIIVGTQTDLRTGRRLSMVMLVLTVGAILFAYYTILRLDYAVTDRRAYVGVGVRAKTVNQLDLDAVTDVVVDQPGWQKWIGIGTIRFVTDGPDELRFSYVENPYGVYQRILDRMDLSG